MDVKKCVISLVGNEKKITRRITGHEKFNDFDIVRGRPAMGVVTIQTHLMPNEGYH